MYPDSTDNVEPSAANPETERLLPNVRESTTLKAPSIRSNLIEPVESEAALIPHRTDRVEPKTEASRTDKEPLTRASPEALRL